MTFDLRGRFLGVVGTIVFVWLVSACSGSSSDQGSAGAVGTSGSAAIGVETSSLFVTVTNRTSQPLLNVQVTINPGRTLSYSTTLPRMEPGEERDLSLGNFTHRDGGVYNAAAARPIQLAVTAVDQTGQKFDVTVPFKR
jgi:hypothetical protein